MNKIMSAKLTIQQNLGVIAEYKDKRREVVAYNTTYLQNLVNLVLHKDFLKLETSGNLCQIVHKDAEQIQKTVFTCSMDLYPILVKIVQNTVPISVR